MKSGLGVVSDGVERGKKARGRNQIVMAMTVEGLAMRAGGFT